MSGVVLEGRLERSDFGGPALVLRVDDGQRYQLKGAVPSSLIGRRVRVQGTRSEVQFGFGMVGPIVDVQTIEAKP